MKKNLLVICLVAVGVSVQAGSIHKCTDTNGRVTFQERPCASVDVKSEVVVSDRQQPAQASRGLSIKWKFEDSVDGMTGLRSCSMVADSFFIGTSGNQIVSVYPAIVSAAGEFAVAFKVSGQRTLVHNNINGLGLRVGEADFQPFTQRYGQSAVGFDPASSRAVIVQLKESDTLRVRMRFWPYDQTHDSQPVRHTGFGVAYNQMLSCLESL